MEDSTVSLISPSTIHESGITLEVLNSEIIDSQFVYLDFKAIKVRDEQFVSNYLRGKGNGVVITEKVIGDIPILNEHLDESMRSRLPWITNRSSHKGYILENFEVTHATNEQHRVLLHRVVDVSFSTSIDPHIEHLIRVIREME